MTRAHGPLPLKATRRRKSGRGLTLIEAVASLVITSILLLAVGQALRFSLVASGASPSGGATESVARGLASDVADQIAADLNVALNFTEKTATAVTFTVPDRNADAAAEKLRYAWSGAAGTATAVPPIPPYTLTRQLNDGPWVALASDVREFSFTHLYRSMSPPPAAAAETLLLGYGINGSGSSDFQVTTTTAAAEVLSPPVPLTASSWSITRIQLQLKCDATFDGVIKVQVRTANILSQPTNTILEEVTVPEVGLSDAYQVIDVPFTKLTNLSKTESLAIVVIGGGGAAPAGTVAHTSALLGIPLGTAYTTLSGGLWAVPLPTSSLRYAIYGKIVP